MVWTISEIFLIGVRRKSKLTITMLKRMTPINKYMLAKYSGKNGDTMLHEIIRTRNKALVDCYLFLVGQKDMQNFKGESPIFLAASLGYHEIVDLLMIEGANPRRCNALGVSPIQVACNNHFHQTVEFFQSIGINPPSDYFDGGKIDWHASIVEGRLERHSQVNLTDDYENESYLSQEPKRTRIK